ncbi:hypothetical protein ACFWA9_38340 [Kitasatospora sp. NPDC059973]|uniref:hypothetical protein n=1 Tax=Kitasatospora sp. NPDC059973 TaxID=3347020 RepID=UPI003683C192
MLTRRATVVAVRTTEVWGGTSMLSVSAAVFFAIVIYLLLARRTEARSRVNERLTAFVCVVFGVVIASSSWGQMILHLVGNVADAVNQAGR